MPYSFDYDTVTYTSLDGWTTNISLSAAQIQQDYEEYRRECERKDRIWELQMQIDQQQMEQQVEEEKQLIKDKEKYPLFFLKEGIV